MRRRFPRSSSQVPRDFVEVFVERAPLSALDRREAIEDRAHVESHPQRRFEDRLLVHRLEDRKSTRLNSSHLVISYAVFCLKKKINMTCFSFYLSIFRYVSIIARVYAFSMFLFILASNLDYACYSASTHSKILYYFYFSSSI